MTTPTTEIKATSEGVSITEYETADNGGAVVASETWHTWSEVAAKLAADDPEIKLEGMTNTGQTGYDIVTENVSGFASVVAKLLPDGWVTDETGDNLTCDVCGSDLETFELYDQETGETAGEEHVCPNQWRAGHDTHRVD